MLAASTVVQRLRSVVTDWRGGAVTADIPAWITRNLWRRLRGHNDKLRLGQHLISVIVIQLRQLYVGIVVILTATPIKRVL